MNNFLISFLMQIIIHTCVYNSIFTFNNHFDKENDCVYKPVIT